MSQSHPWLLSHPVSKSAERLIIGTHPPMPYSLDNVQFYYGNMNEFWKLIAKVYKKDLFPKGEYSLDNIKKFLEEFNFSVTDMVYETSDGNVFNQDSGMLIESLNPNLSQWLKESAVTEIFLTSFSGTNGTLSLFKRWIRQENLQIKIRPYRNWMENGCTINLYGREIKLMVLYSPSPNGRRGIPKSKFYKTWKLNNNENVDDFRVYWYKKFFPKEVIN